MGSGMTLLHGCGPLWPTLIFEVIVLPKDPFSTQNLLTDKTQYAEWDLNKTSNTFTETLTALFLMA